MVFESKRMPYKEDHLYMRHHSLEEPLSCLNSPFFFTYDRNFDKVIGEKAVENALLGFQQECDYSENSENRYTSIDDVLDDQLSLSGGGMYDLASCLAFDNCMEDPKDESTLAFRRERELEDVIMQEKYIRSQSNFNDQAESNKGSRLYCPDGVVLKMPNREICLSPPGQALPAFDVRAPRGPTIDLQGPRGYSTPTSLSHSQIDLDESLKRRWCARRNAVPHPPSVGKSSQWRLTLSRRPEFPALLQKIVIKVRNVHPTACLHELHVQRQELFPKKPMFDMSKYTSGRRKMKGNFLVVCTFEFNGASLSTRHTEYTKSDAKLNAARSMLLKLKSIPNLRIVLDDESTNIGTFSLFEHPRCQLLYLHDSNPEMYPTSPTFLATRTEPRTRSQTRWINMICHFQVGREKLATIGAAHNKKQAIVQAARNMLKRLFPYKTNRKDSRNDQSLSDKMKNPWTCHFCNKYMTGLKPFLSHMTGRSHLTRMLEQGLNAAEENKILLAAAEKAFEEREELKGVVNCAEGVSAELPCSKTPEFNSIFDTNPSSQESDVKSVSSSSSEKSEFETSYCHSSSSDMQATE